MLLDCSANLLSKRTPANQDPKATRGKNVTKDNGKNHKSDENEEIEDIAELDNAVAEEIFEEATGHALVTVPYAPRCTMIHESVTIRTDGTVTLRTFHYLQVEPAKNVPVLIGFINDVEKDFFLTFIR